MNGKQFINTAVLELADWVRARWEWTGQAGRAVVDILFPRFLRLPIPRDWRNGLNRRELLLGYLFVAVLILVLQAIWAAVNGMFLPDSDPATKTFIEDRPNLINYALLCPAYCLTGFVFLVRTYGIRTLLRRNEVPVPVGDRSVLRGGYLGALAILVVSMIVTAGYAIEIHNYSSHYWFMSSGPPEVSLGAAGYYYLFINLLLLVFILWVGFANFGLFHVARDISAFLRSVARNSDMELIREWADEEAVKRRLAAFAWQVLTSKLMVFWIILNMVTWKYGEANVGVMFRLSVVFTAVFGIWVFSLPRYAVQRHIFKIRQLVGVSSYPDIRGPWVLGLSSFLDLLLFSFAVHYLLGDGIGKVMEKLLG